MSVANLPPRPQTKDGAMQAAMTRVSIVASIVAGFLMLIGFVVFLFSSIKIPGKGELHRLPAPTISQFFSRSVYKTPSAYLGLGLLVLSLTPILRVLVAMSHYWQAKEFKHAAAALGVLG